MGVAEEGRGLAWCRDWKVHTVLAAVPSRPGAGSGWGAGSGSGSSEATAHPLLLRFPLALSSLTCRMLSHLCLPRDAQSGAFPSGRHIRPKPMRRAYPSKSSRPGVRGRLSQLCIAGPRGRLQASTRQRL